MATMKKKQKKRIILAVVIVLIIAIAATVISLIAVNESIPEVALYKVSANDIYETVTATGQVSSGVVKEYKVDAVATVKEVMVKTGDEVKQGDLLATFDTSNFDAQIVQLQTSYDQAKAGYKDALESQKQAKKNLADVQQKIAVLEKKNANLKEKASQAAANAATSTMPSVPNVTAPSRPNVTIPTAPSAPQESATSSISDTTAFSRPNVSAPSVSLPSVSVPSNIATSNTLSANSSGAAQQPATDFDAALLENAVSGIDWTDVNAVAAAVANSNAELTSNELMLAAYYIQAEMYSSMASDTLVSAKKDLMNSTKSALDTLNEAKQEMEAGWKAAFDGTITECSIFAGEQTSLLTKGIVLQNLNDMVVTLSLGEYDIHKVKVDMPAAITTAYGSYTGKVISKSPVATGGSTSSIMDSVGSSMGISGLSSLTQSGAGVEVQISVDNPDENIIIGFDASVEIDVGEHIGITTVPSNSMVLDKTGSYVFVYDEESETVTKTLIETGATSVSDYEVLSGVELGDMIVLAPQSTYEDSFKARIKELS